MPADWRTGRVLGQEDVRDVVGRQACKLSRARSQGQEEIRNRIGLLEAASIEVIALAERDDPSFRNKALKAKRFKRKDRDARNELALFFLRDELAAVSESIRRTVRRKEIAVCFWWARHRFSPIQRIGWYHLIMSCHSSVSVSRGNAVNRPLNGHRSPAQ